MKPEFINKRRREASKHTQDNEETYKTIKYLPLSQLIDGYSFTWQFPIDHLSRRSMGGNFLVCPTQPFCCAPLPSSTLSLCMQNATNRSRPFAWLRKSYTKADFETARERRVSRKFYEWLCGVHIPKEVIRQSFTKIFFIKQSDSVEPQQLAHTFANETRLINFRCFARSCLMIYSPFVVSFPFSARHRSHTLISSL